MYGYVELVAASLVADLTQLTLNEQHAVVVRQLCLASLENRHRLQLQLISCLFPLRKENFP